VFALLNANRWRAGSNRANQPHSSPADTPAAGVLSVGRTQLRRSAPWYQRSPD